jgi:transketolase
MRAALAKLLSEQYSHGNSFFITGDVGFRALEGVRDAFGSRFINAGVSEQNMIGVAAGLAREGAQVFVYTIAPFCYARPFEQIRNDIVMHGLPVCLIGNGGGYAYGSMGPSHHALEDCAVMKAIGVSVLAPCFDQDLPPLISGIRQPTYLRLGYEDPPKDNDIPAYAPWRQVLSGNRGVIAAFGPLAGTAWRTFAEKDENRRPAIWAVGELDCLTIPAEFWKQAARQPLYVIEEHKGHGGLGMSLTLESVKGKRPIKKFTHRFALGYPSGRFGSQTFHRRESGLDEASLLSMISET